MYLMKCINEEGGSVHAGTEKAVRTLNAVGLGDCNLNFVLSDGDKLWGFRKGDNGHTLFYYDNPSSQEYRALASTPPPSSSSSPANDVDDPDTGVWHPLSNWQLIEISFDGTNFVGGPPETIPQDQPSHVHKVTSGMSIQAAINAANDGDVICVHAGSYDEDVDLTDKALTLVAYNGADVKLTDGTSGGGILDVIFVSTDSVSISGFDIIPNYSIDQGITVWGAYSQSGISFVVITNCTIAGPVSRGILLNRVRWGIVINNTIDTPDIGIALITHSNVSDENEQILENKVHGTSTTMSQGFNVYLEAGVSWLEFNTITNYDVGIKLDRITSGTVVNGNTIKNNNIAITLEHSHDNTIYHNNFINNAMQVKSSDSINIWDNGYPSGGNYWSNYAGRDIASGPNQDLVDSGDGIGDDPYPIDTNNRDNYPLMQPYLWSPHDTGIISVTTSKTVTGQGYNVSTSVTVKNQGDYTETFNITVYANTTAIRTEETTLTSGGSTTTTFVWNTTGFAKGNYTISAVASTVPGETDTTDNAYADGTVTVVMEGDLNADGIVDISDIVLVAKSFGSQIGHPRYDLNMDINDDDSIDISDIVIVAKNFGKTDC
jgi:parallel beta-helix repeat protein